MSGTGFVSAVATPGPPPPHPRSRPGQPSVHMWHVFRFPRRPFSESGQY